MSKDVNAEFILMAPYVTLGRGKKIITCVLPLCYGPFLEGTVFLGQAYKIEPLSSEMAVMSIFCNKFGCLPTESTTSHCTFLFE